MKKVSVLFTTNIPVPYRVSFFNELGKYVNLTVAFERKSAGSRNSNWLSTNFTNFNGIFLSGISIGDDLSFSPEIINLIRKGGFDRIIIGIYYSPTGILATQYLRLSHHDFIFSCDGGFIKDEPSWKFKIKSYLQGGAKMYLSTSSVCDQLLQHYGVAESTIRKYPFTSIMENEILGQQPDSAAKKALKKKLCIKEEFCVIGVGRLLDWKGWDIFADISNLSDNIGYYIIGGAPIGTPFEFMDSSKYPHVHFIDFKQKEDLSLYYQAADIFVLPSSKEVWGLVVNEAMAHGLPVITTTACGAGNELIEQGVNGYTYEPKNANELRTRINRLIEDPQLRYSMGIENLKKSHAYTIEKMAFQCASYIIDNT